ncbi:MAG: hypothetical protein EBY22_17315, partial [Gammaproteobacteria bacterium]|nr:hypothetical protein [Gammaproteobacteria bacterium]
VVGVGVSWWWGALIWAQQTHVTLAVPGVEKDFRSFVTRSDTFAHVLQADPFYNLGYPLILWAIQQLTHASPFDAARWWAVAVAGLALFSSWWLARTLVGRGWDALLVLCVAGSGLFVQYSLLLGSDMTFTWLCTLTIAFIIYAPQRSQWWWLGAGLSAGAAYLVRHTGLVLCLTCLGWMMYQQRRSTLSWRQIGLFCGGMLLIALPQLWVNFRDTGMLLFNYQAKNIALTRLIDLMGKVIIFSSDGYQGSSLEEIINYSWNYPKLKRLHYTAVDEEFEGKTPTSSTSSSSTSTSQLQTDVDKTKSIIEYNELKKFNMSALTIVVPQKEGDFLTKNFDATNAWQLGCQFVCMNFQKIDKNMDIYVNKFKN